MPFQIAQRIERSLCNPRIEGSNPSGNYTSFSVSRRMNPFSSENCSLCTLKIKHFIHCYLSIAPVVSSSNFYDWVATLTTNSLLLTRAYNNIFDWLKQWNYYIWDILLSLNTSYVATPKFRYIKFNVDQSWRRQEPNNVCWDNVVNETADFQPIEIVVFRFQHNIWWCSLSQLEKTNFALAYRMFLGKIGPQ